MAERKYLRVDNVTDGLLPQPLSIADALKTRGTGFSFFTPALLFMYGGFDRDPVVEFGSYYSCVSSSRVFCVDLKRDHEFFFRGIGTAPAPGSRTTVNWDKRLYVSPQDMTDSCFAFLGGLGWSCPKTQFFGRTFAYDISIPDPTVSPTQQPPDISVRVFGVVAADFVVFLDPAASPPIVRKIFTPAPLDVLSTLGADIATYKTIVNPFMDDADG